MTKRTPPRVTLTAIGEAKMSWPYCPPMLEALKTTIPYRFRDWDPTRKIWTIYPAYVDVAIAMLLSHFPDAEVPRRARTRTTTIPPAGNDPFAILHLRETAPPELIHAAYRCLAKIHHPDKAGDPAIMRQLTEAHDALTRRLSA